MKRSFCRSRWKIVSSCRFWSKMKLSLWTIRWKKKNWRSFRFRSKKKRDFFASSKNVRSYRFRSKMKRSFFVFRKKDFRSCRFRSKMKSNFRSRERTVSSFRMKLKFRTIRKKKIWWKTSISKFCFSSSVADKSCFRRFDFKSKKIRWFFNWHSKRQRRKFEKKNKKKQKKNSDAFEFRIRKRTDFVVKKSCFFCVDEKKKKNVDNFSKFLMNNEKIFWFLILMKTFFFWFLFWFFFSMFH